MAKIKYRLLDAWDDSKDWADRNPQIVHGILIFLAGVLVGAWLG